MRDFGKRKSRLSREDFRKDRKGFGAAKTQDTSVESSDLGDLGTGFGVSGDWWKLWTDLVEETCKEKDCIFYDTEFTKNRILRVYIDKQGTPVGLEDCTQVARSLNEKLEVKDLVPGGEYQLEVSTPGLDRHLRTDWHFDRVEGQKIHLRMKRSLEELGQAHAEPKNAKQFEAIFQKREGDRLLLDFLGVEVRIPLEEVLKAKLVFDMTDLKDQ